MHNDSCISIFAYSMIKTMKIFLDSKDWITLARIADGKETDSKLQKVYEKIKKLSDSETAIFPFSMFHLDDIMKRSNKESRDKVIDVMIDISKGWVMKPYLIFFKKEIENATLNRLGKPFIHDISSQIFGKGIAYTAGEEYYVTSSNPEVQKFLDKHDDELRQKANSIESMRLLLKNDEFVQTFREWKEPYDELATQLEKNREYKRQMTKSQRYDFELVAHFKRSITPHLGKFLYELQIPPENVISSNHSDLNKFLENMPSLNVYLQLIIARDDDSPDRAVQSSDMNDICHLSGAIPYCDIVVIDKMFAHLSKKQQLDKKYNCIVCNSLLELNSAIS